jgi:hypothetical protein
VNSPAVSVNSPVVFVNSFELYHPLDSMAQIVEDGDYRIQSAQGATKQLCLELRDDSTVIAVGHNNKINKQLVSPEILGGLPRSLITSLHIVEGQSYRKRTIPDHELRH